MTIDGTDAAEERSEQRVTVSFGTHTYWVSTDVDRASLERRIVSALRSGGDLVEIPRENARSVSILVSAGAEIVIETRDVESFPASGFSRHEAHELMWADEFDIGRLADHG